MLLAFKISNTTVQYRLPTAHLIVIHLQSDVHAPCCRSSLSIRTRKNSITLFFVIGKIKCNFFFISNIWEIENWSKASLIPLLPSKATVSLLARGKPKALNLSLCVDSDSLGFWYAHIDIHILEQSSALLSGFVCFFFAEKVCEAVPACSNGGTGGGRSVPEGDWESSSGSPRSHLQQGLRSHHASFSVSASISFSFICFALACLCFFFFWLLRRRSGKWMLRLWLFRLALFRLEIPFVLPVSSGHFLGSQTLPLTGNFKVLYQYWLPCSIRSILSITRKIEIGGFLSFLVNCWLSLLLI